MQLKQDLQDFFKNKAVFLTGHTGFKGSWLSILLHDLGAIVTGYARDCHSPEDNFVLSGMSTRMTDIRGDLVDYELLKNSLIESKAEIVFHLAAQPLVRYSYENPRETYMSNVIGTLNLLEAVRESKYVKAVVIVTTDKCYENKEWFWGYRETDPLAGHDPYSSSKACAELLAASYRSSFFDPENPRHHKAAIATARAGNVIGGGDWAQDRIVPDCIRNLKGGLPIVIRNPYAVRPWQHVIEPLVGYLMLAKALYINPEPVTGAFNFGPESGSMVPVRDLVEKMIRSYGSGRWEAYSSTNAPHEANLLYLDITKSKQLLHWHPVWSIDTCIAKTVEWYQHFQTQDVYTLCVQQIHAYFGALSL